MWWHWKRNRARCVSIENLKGLSGAGIVVWTLPPGPQVVVHTGANFILHVKYTINERITRYSKSNEVDKFRAHCR